MNVSTITNSNECRPRRNLFIQFSNSFMSVPETKNPVEKAQEANKSAKKDI